MGRTSSSESIERKLSLEREKARRAKSSYQKSMKAIDSLEKEIEKQKERELLHAIKSSGRSHKEILERILLEP